MIWIDWKKFQILFLDCVQSELFSYFLQSFLKWVSSSVPRIRVNQVTGFQADLLDPVFLTATLWMKRNEWSSPTFFFLCSQKHGNWKLDVSHRKRDSSVLHVAVKCTMTFGQHAQWLNGIWEHPTTENFTVKETLTISHTKRLGSYP